MANVLKSGLDYFSFDVDFFEDEKIEFISAKFGIKGEIIAVKLLCRIYRNGYYIKWGKDESLLFAKRVGDGVTDALVSSVVSELIRRGFFDKTIFDRFQILTSRGIQKRYIEATKRRKDVDMKEDYYLLGDQNVNINRIDVNINRENVNINSQRKEKESKEKESKGNYNTIPLQDFQIIESFLNVHPEYKAMLEKNQFKEDDPYYLLYKRLKLICTGDMIGGVTGFQALKTAVDNIKAEDWFVNNGGLFMLINPSKPIGFAKTNIAKYMRKLKNGNTGNYKKQTTRPTATRGFGEQTVRVISL